MKNFLSILSIVAMGASVVSVQANDVGTLDNIMEQNSSAFKEMLLKKSSQESSPLVPFRRSFTTTEDVVTGACNTTTPITETVETFTYDALKFNKFYNCSDSGLSYLSSRYSTERCTRAIACQKDLLNDEKTTKAKDLINKLVAKDIAKNALANNYDGIEKMMVLKLFAMKKFGIQATGSCKLGSEEKSNDKNCNLKLMADAFEELQETCQGGSACFNQDYSSINLPSFSVYKEKVEKQNEEEKENKEKENKEKENKAKKNHVAIDFVKNRWGVINQKKMDADSEYLDKLYKVISSAKFKNLKYPQSRMKMLLEEIGTDASGLLKDPILGVDLADDNQANLHKSDKVKDLVKLLGSKGLSKQTFIAGFDDFRKKRAQAILTDSNACKKSSSVESICREMSALSNGFAVEKDSKAAESLVSQDIRTIKGMDELQEILGPEFDQKYLGKLLDAKRCSAFKIASDMYSTANSNTSFTDAGSYDPDDPNADYSGPKNAEERDRDNEMNFNTFLVDGVKGKKTDGLDSEDETTKDFEGNGELGDKFASALGGSPSINGTNNPFSDSISSNAFTDYNSAIIRPKNEEKKDVAEEAKIENESAPATGSVNDKVNELMKRLASAEEKVEKMKADGEAAEEDRIKQKKIDEENALIKELKSQIGELKSQASKKEIASAPATVKEIPKQQTLSNYSGGYNPGALISARSDSSTAKASAPSEKYEQARGAAPIQSNGSIGQSSGKSTASMGAILTATNSDGSRTSTLPSGVVVTTIDGLTSEKATRAISNKIMELNGTPFLIEEGGLVKEIIPVIKDGKVVLDEKGNPVFEKIVKGKIGDQKFAGKASKDRKPASITDAADLKRDQEEKLKRERAEYLKLKNITSGAIEKK